MSPSTSRGEASVAILAETFGLSRQAVYAARAAHQAASERSGRRPARPSVPVAEAPTPGRGVPVATLSEAIDSIVQEQPAWGIRKVWAVLRRRGLHVGRRRVHAMMRASGLVLPRDSEGPRDPAPRGHVTTPEPNRRIAVDFTTVWTAEDGNVAVAIGVDCGCRSVLDVTVTKSQSSGAILASADRALQAAFGSPAEVADGVELRSDHGPQYTGYDAEVLVQAWGVTHTFAPVGRPTGNAVAERTIRTMKEECIWLCDWRNLAELHEALQAWARTFNHDRPHQALGWQTPAERRAEHLGPPQRKAA